MAKGTRTRRAVSRNKAARSKKATSRKKTPRRKAARKTARKAARKTGRRTAERSKARAADRLAWWREARFGMFIHWGLYALPAGRWGGREVPGLAEWLQHRARVPVAEYAKLARRFRASKFDARQWVALAKQAGMKYVVFTAKHHDGFAMYDSHVDDYTVVKQTPFGRDPLADLARECRRAGLRLGLYYSQTQDWAHPDAEGNDWDFAPKRKDFNRYLRDKALPQIRELLTRYGPVALMWFDLPEPMTRAQSLSLKRLVRRLQPGCLVSGRIGNEVFDYDSLGDNQTPRRPMYRDIETPATMNDTWGYKRSDTNWKSAAELIHLVADHAGKGVNYLLNVGPMGNGQIPPASVSRLKKIGAWMKTNAAAIHGTQPSPYPYVFDWGRMTWKGHKLYLLFTHWPPQHLFGLYGLRTRIRRAYPLAARHRTIPYVQVTCQGVVENLTVMKLPRKATDRPVAVVVLELDGPPEVDPSPMQQHAGRISLFGHLAELHRTRGSKLDVTRGGSIKEWRSTRDYVHWDFGVCRPGRFRVQAVIARGMGRTVWGGPKVRLVLDGKRLCGGVLQARTFDALPETRHFPQATTTLGTVRIAAPGRHRLEVHAERIPTTAPDGLTLASVEFHPLG